jgi:hypothetical protein
MGPLIFSQILGLVFTLLLLAVLGDGQAVAAIFIGSALALAVCWWVMRGKNDETQSDK